MVGYLVCARYAEPFGRLFISAFSNHISRGNNHTRVKIWASLNTALKIWIAILKRNEGYTLTAFWTEWRGLRMSSLLMHPPPGGLEAAPANVTFLSQGQQYRSYIHFFFCILSHQQHPRKFRRRVADCVYRTTCGCSNHVRILTILRKNLTHFEYRSYRHDRLAT